MNMLQSLFIAVLQGATELFPVSSLGHAVLLPALLGWTLNEADPNFLPFLVMLHLGTAAALLLYFWRDWLALATGILGFQSTAATRRSRRLLLLIIVATIPAVVVGAGLEHLLRSLFSSALVAAAFLAINGVLLLAGERLRGSGRRPLTDMTILDALLVGCWQCAALIPGISRSGATIVGGLLRGIDHEAAAHFSFLIATPVILGAVVLEVPKLLHESVAPGVFSQAAVAAGVAGVTAFASTAFLMRYFRLNDQLALNPFAYYCIAIGLGGAAYLLLA